MSNLLLGKNVEYISTYSPSLLCPIKRHNDDASALPMFGYDIWNAYEISWLRIDRRPNVAIGEIIYSCDSPFIIESKSLKLYLNSLNNSVFDSIDLLSDTIKHDLSLCLETDVIIKLRGVSQVAMYDNVMDINIDDMYVPSYRFDGIKTYRDKCVDRKRIVSNLLKSNCPVTNQPDWGTVIITYSGYEIDYASLLHYIIGLRDVQEFHEHCVERIYRQIYMQANPTYLEVYARYTRRGGIDINPYRSSVSCQIPINHRTSRQ